MTGRPFSSPARRAASAPRSPSASRRTAGRCTRVDLADGDLATREGNRAVVDAALERFGGRLDAVVANAGFQHVAPVRDFPEEQWDKLQALLVTSPFLLAKYTWDALAASGDGRFLAVASVHGLVASPFKAGYVAAKHGVLGLVKVLALEGADVGISASALCPAYVRTAIVEAAARGPLRGGPARAAGREADARAGRGGRGGGVAPRTRRPGRHGRAARHGSRLDLPLGGTMSVAGGRSPLNRKLEEEDRMPGWAWALIVVAAVAVVAIVVWQAMRARRTRTLQGRFGPEYDRAARRAESKRSAEAELAARADRRDKLEITPLRGRA